MKNTILLLILLLSNYVVVSQTNRDPRSKDQANVFWDGTYPLYSLDSDEPILPNENGDYFFWATTNEDPTPKQVLLKKGKQLFVYKFITYSECVQRCNSIRKSQELSLVEEKSASTNSKKELVYTSILNTSSKDWQTEFNQIKSQSIEFDLATKRIELYNTIITKYENESIKLNVRGKKNAVEEYNLIRENNLFLISQKSVIKKILKSLKNAKILMEQRDIDKSIAYCIKDKNNVISCVYVKYSGKWSCCKIFDNNEKVNLIKLILKNEIPPIEEQSKTGVITSLTGLDENYFSYTSKQDENTKIIENFIKNNTKVENLKYKYVGSFNSDGTKKWGFLLDEDKDTLFVGKWENDFPSLENGKTFIYKYSEQKVFLEKNGMIFRYNTKNASVYVGEARYSGFGTQIYSISGEYYIGNYLDGYLHGYGSYFYNNGYYEGQWVKNHRTGEGKYFFNNGEVWSGEWNNGKFTGMGKKTFKNGQVEEGLYENDKLIKSLAQIEDENKRIEREKIEEQNRIEQEQNSKEQEKKISEKETALALSKIKWNPVSNKKQKCKWCSNSILCEKKSEQTIELEKAIWISTGVINVFFELNKLDPKRYPYLIDYNLYECPEFCSEKCGYEYRRVH